MYLVMFLISGLNALLKFILINLYRCGLISWRRTEMLLLRHKQLQCLNPYLSFHFLLLMLCITFSLTPRPSREFKLRQPLDWLIHHLRYHNLVIGALQSINGMFRASAALLHNRADVVFDPRLVKEADKEKQKRESEKMGDAMKSLENRTLDSKWEIDILAALDEMKSMKICRLHLEELMT